MRKAAILWRGGSRCLLAVFALALVACGRSSSNVMDFAGLVEAVSPSVVNISATVADEPPPLTEARNQNPPQDTPDWLNRFLNAPKSAAGTGNGDSNRDPANADTPGKADADNQDRPQSLGSGFILSPDGYILTNQHVVKGAREIIVRLSDRRQLPAKLIGGDERSDLALLKIEATDLPAVKLGDIKRLRVGEWVLAIGSPFGFDYSVTAGIVSAKGRSLETEQYVPFIQTDTAINPGNSGGPLFNLKGEVVGVNSQIYSQTGGFMGVAFSVPIDVAAKVAAQLKEHGRVTRGWLGVMVRPIGREEAEKLGMADKPIGALVQRIVANSPAEQAALRVGDAIVSINGVELASSRDLPALIGNVDPGESASLVILRDSRRIETKVEVGTLAAPEELSSADADVGVAAPLGLTVRALSDKERALAKVLASGALVVKLAPGAARDAGVEIGDVLLRLAGQDVDGPERYAEVAARLTPGQTVPLLIQRRGQPLFLQLAVPS